MNLRRTAPYLAGRYFALASAHVSLFLLTGWSRKDVTAVLMYHSIEVSLPWAVSAALFRKQMAFLRANFRVVPFCQIKAESQRPRGTGGVIAVTFDDGRLDNYINALPILQDTGVKATFFVTTGTIGRVFKTDRYQTPMMDERQLKELASLGHEIGSHTVTHPPLTQVPRAVAHSEMRDSKRHLEDLFGMPIASIAYPYGDHNREVRDCAAEVGFTTAGIVRNALVTPQSDWLLIPRVGIDETLGSGLYFRAKLSRALEVYERLWGAPSGPHEYLPVRQDPDSAQR